MTSSFDQANTLGLIYDQIENGQALIEACKLLVQTLVEYGLSEAARDANSDLLVLDRHDPEARAWRVQLAKTAKRPAPLREATRKKLKALEDPVEDITPSVKRLREKYEAVGANAKIIQFLLKSVHAEQRIPDLIAIAEGKRSIVAEMNPLRSVGSVAAAMNALGTSDGCEEINFAFKDLQRVIGWLRSQPSGGAGPSVKKPASNDDFI
ncbi:MAG: hypothetical protein M1814_001384 [Vezdaea aestivalis]|nr:MAG: hypothetical protein M1814_001384 [Vezdaea aestivalis]